MTRRLALGVVTAVLMAVLGVLRYDRANEPGRDASSQTPRTSQAMASMNREIGPIEGYSRTTSSSFAPKTAPANVSHIVGKLLASSDLKHTLEQIQADSLIAVKDRLFAVAQILDACGLREKAASSAPPELVAALRSGSLDDAIVKAKADVKNDRQRVAIEKSIRSKLVYLCRNFANSISDEDVDRAYESAAAAGNPTAQARVIDKRLADSAVQNVGKLPSNIREGLEKPAGFPEPITPAEQTQLVNALFTEDPLAIRHAGMVMSTGSEQQSLRVGADRVDLGEYADETWTLVACQFGFECGSSNLIVNNACAQFGQCANTFEDLLRDYGLTPEQFNRVRQNAQILADAIRRRDISAFTWVNSPGQVRMVLAVPGIVRIH